MFEKTTIVLRKIYPPNREIYPPNREIYPPNREIYPQKRNLSTTWDACNTLMLANTTDSKQETMN